MTKTTFLWCCIQHVVATQSSSSYWEEHHLILQQLHSFCPAFGTASFGVPGVSVRTSQVPLVRVHMPLFEVVLRFHVHPLHPLAPSIRHVQGHATGPGGLGRCHAAHSALDASSRCGADAARTSGTDCRVARPSGWWCQGCVSGAAVRFQSYGVYGT